jgi:tartrate-resistant acid phosphatase type 5
MNRKRKYKLYKSMQTEVFICLMILAQFSYFTTTFARNKKISSSSARFLIISDWGGFASDNQKLVAAAMGREAEKISAQFVLTLGDNYHGEGISGESDPRWKSEYEEIYNSPFLQIPWYPSLGNHDYRGSAQGEIAYSSHSNRWRFPARYYAHKEKISGPDSILIIHLDTSPFVGEYFTEKSEYRAKVTGQDTGLQLKWLDSLLSASKARWTLVVGHHPIYSAAPKHGDTKELIEKVLPILEKHHVIIYACGHDHVLQHLKNSGMNFFICGGGAEFREVSKRNDVVFGIGSLGFLSVKVTKNSFKATYIDGEGNILHTAVIKNR